MRSCASNCTPNTVVSPPTTVVSWPEGVTPEDLGRALHDRERIEIADEEIAVVDGDGRGNNVALRRRDIGDAVDLAIGRDLSTGHHGRV